MTDKPDTNGEEFQVEFKESYYPKPVQAQLDKFLTDLCVKRKKGPEFTCATGKIGVIEIQKARWRASGISEEEIEKGVQNLQNILEDRIYIVTNG